MKRSPAVRTGVSLRHSIGTRLFLGLIAMGLVTAALGLYGLNSLARVAGIVADTYDRPLQAINLSGSARFTFAQMDKEALRRRVAEPSARPAIDGHLAELTKSFFEDLSFADQRLLSDRERERLSSIRALVTRWADAASAEAPAIEAREDALSTEIAEAFDRLVEQTVDDSFLERRQSLLTVQRFEMVNSTVIGLAFALSVAITYGLTRRIFRPLSQAAAAAELIGRGELQTPLPPGGPDETGILLASLTLMRDRLREMMEHEQAQRRSAQGRLIDAIESSDEGMVLVDAEGRIVLANQRFNALFETFAGALGLPAAPPPPGSPPWPPGSPAARLFEAGGELPLPDGRWIRVSRSPTREGGYFLFLGDITDLKEREESFKAAKIAAEAASIAKTQFLANMSHELRTPLNAIIGFSDMFVGEYFGPLGHETYMQYAREINASGWRLLEIIQNVLDLSHSLSGSLELKAEPYDLRETIEESRRPLAKACAEAKLALDVGMPDEPLLVRGDPDKLRRILDNLTSNAVKFSTPGGRIAVLADGDETRVRFAVSDTGIGMAAEDVPLAFSAFGQVDARLARRYEGTGLGLPLAKAFVELHGGEIGIASTPGQGTTVTVTLPRLVGVEATA
jgi:signal transduction histidine kinase